jgi:hypothetical protein
MKGIFRMKAPLSFGLVVAVAGALACSDEGGKDRETGGTGGQTGNTGGTSAGTAGTSAAGTAGTGTGGTAGTGSSSAGTYGPALVINADGTVKDENGTTGINGAALVVASSANPSAVQDFRDGKLCMHGATAAGFTDYGLYWGAQINVDLKRVANPAAGDAGAAPGDAGADAGDAGGGEVLGTEAGPWDPHPLNIIGFNFTIDGPTVAPVLSVSAAPTGRLASADPFCYRGINPVSGNSYDVLFTDLRLACWDNPPITSSVFQITTPDAYTTLNNLGWQINAAPELAYMFDFCISEIKPIIAN